MQGEDKGGIRERRKGGRTAKRRGRREEVKDMRDMRDNSTKYNKRNRQCGLDTFTRPAGGR